MILDETKKISDVIYVWPLGSGELPRFGAKPRMTAFYFSGSKSREVCKVDTGGRENDRKDYAELCIPTFEISFTTKKLVDEARAIQQLQKMERERFNLLYAAAQKNGNKILLEDSVMMVRQGPTRLPIEETGRELWYEEVSIALMTRKKKGERRNEYVWPKHPPRHEKGCHIFTHGKKRYHGICTCGEGLEYFRDHGDDSHLFAKRNAVVR